MFAFSLRPIKRFQKGINSKANTSNVIVSSCKVMGFLSVVFTDGGAFGEKESKGWSLIVLSNVS